ncbi:MAG: hypothetical protein LBK63_02820, partial [Treponema sp.]|nr:hypothetical protein [Treponema sp.]
MRKEAMSNGQRTGKPVGGGREGKSSVRSAGRFPPWKAAGLQTRTPLSVEFCRRQNSEAIRRSRIALALSSFLFALYVGTCALPMGLEGLNPLRKAAEYLIPGTNLLYYFREPVTGVQPLTEFEAPGYTGKVVWKAGEVPLNGGFAAETEYTAVVTLSADTDGGFAFNVPAAPEPGSFSHSRSAGVSHDAGTGATLTLTVAFAATGSESGGSQPGAPEVVEYNLQRYVPVPVAGQAPVTELKQPNLALSVQWQDQDGKPIAAPGPFEEGVQYRAIIMLMAQGTWKFVKDYPFAYYPSTSVEYQEDSTKASENNRVVVVTYKPTGEPKKVTNLDLTRHIPAPVKGATAMWSVLGDENRYTGSMQWEVSDAAGWTDMPSGVFQPGTTYRAVAVLYAGPGYVFDQNAAVSHDDATGLSEPEIKTANVLNVTISFPATANDPVTDMNLTSKVP